MTNNYPLLDKYGGFKEVPRKYIYLIDLADCFYKKHVFGWFEISEYNLEGDVAEALSSMQKCELNKFKRGLSGGGNDLLTEGIVIAVDCQSSQEELKKVKERICTIRQIMNKNSKISMQIPSTG